MAHRTITITGNNINIGRIGGTNKARVISTHRPYLGGWNLNDRARNIQYSGIKRSPNSPQGTCYTQREFLVECLYLGMGKTRNRTLKEALDYTGAYMINASNSLYYVDSAEQPTIIINFNGNNNTFDSLY